MDIRRGKRIGTIGQVFEETEEIRQENATKMENQNEAQRKLSTIAGKGSEGSLKKEDKENISGMFALVMKEIKKNNK